MARINVWSSPRNISTAFMYSFAQRSDMTVVDEPLYAHYLLNTDSKATHPARQEILDTQINDGEKVVSDVIFGEYDTQHVLFKQMTHHFIKLREDFIFKTDNIILIRDPRRILASYSKVISNPTMQDVGIAKQVEMFNKLKSKGKLAAIVDAKQLLLNPKKVLSELCESLNLNFEESMLSWDKGPRPEDGIWAPYWYANVHQSTGFIKYVEKKVELTGQLAELAEEAQSFYDYLFEYAIKA